MSSPFRVLEFEQIQIQFQVAPLTADNMAEHLASEASRIRARIAEARGESVLRRAVVLLDSTVDLIPPPAVRKLQADWIKEQGDLLKLVCHAMGFVVPRSGVIRGALTAIMWLAPVPVPTTVHASMEQALDWAITEVDKIGGVVPGELLLGGAELVARRTARLMA